MFSGMRSRLTYANITSSLALFLALGGGAAYAANEWGSANIRDNTLESRDLKDNAGVKSQDVVDDTVAGGGLAGRDIRESTLARVPAAANASRLGGDPPSSFQRRGTTTSCSTGDKVTGIGADGNVSCAPDKEGTASGSAGGDLTGDYPNPSIAPNAVNGSKVANGSLSGEDINVSTLGRVPDSTRLGGETLTNLRTDWTVRCLGGFHYRISGGCLQHYVFSPNQSFTSAAWQCSDVGGRLPTHQELQAARLSGHPLANGEWTGSSVGDNTALYVNNPASTTDIDGESSVTTQRPYRCMYPKENR